MDFSNVTDFGNMLGEDQVWVGIWFHSDSSGVLTVGAYVDDILVRKCVGGGCPVSASRISGPDSYELKTFPAVKSLPRRREDEVRARPPQLNMVTGERHYLW